MKKSKLLFFTIPFLFNLIYSNNTFSQSNNWMWAKTANGINDDYTVGMQADVSGNIVATGSFFSHTLKFGSISLTNAGTTTTDVFYAKYDAKGNVLWAKSFGSLGDDKPTGIATDNNGNIFITGIFTSDTLTIGSTRLINSSVWEDVFIAKFDSTGKALWAKSAGGDSRDFSGGIDVSVGNSIAVDPTGNVFITGEYSSPVMYFDANDSIMLVGSSDIYIAKYNTSGSLQWVKSLGGASTQGGYSIATDNSGNAIITGYYTSNQLTVGSNTLTDNGNGNVFVIKYSSSGSVVWSKSGGGRFADYGNAIATDHSGNIYVTGEYDGDSIGFGNITLVTSTPISKQGSFFIFKFDNTGNALWGNSSTYSSTTALHYEYGDALAVDSLGNAYVCGYFTGQTITIGGVTVTNASAGSGDIFVARFKPTSGDLVWLLKAGGTDDDNSRCVTYSKNTVFVGGSFRSAPMSFGSINLTGFGGYDIFVAAISTTTGIMNTEDQENNLILYPNPTYDGKVYIKGVSNQDNYKVRIYNLMGEIVYTNDYNSNQPLSDINLNVKGFYLVELISTNGDKITRKVIYY